MGYFSSSVSILHRSDKRININKLTPLFTYQHYRAVKIFAVNAVLYIVYIVLKTNKENYVLNTIITQSSNLIRQKSQSTVTT